MLLENYLLSVLSIYLPLKLDLNHKAISVLITGIAATNTNRLITEMEVTKIIFFSKRSRLCGYNVAFTIQMEMNPVEMIYELCAVPAVSTFCSKRVLMVTQ